MKLFWRERIDPARAFDQARNLDRVAGAMYQTCRPAPSLAPIFGNVRVSGVKHFAIASYSKPLQLQPYHRGAVQRTFFETGVATILVALCWRRSFSRRAKI